MEDPGSSPSRSLNLCFLLAGECPGNGAWLDHDLVGFGRSQNILLFVPGQEENSLGTSEIFQDR